MERAIAFELLIIIFILIILCLLHMDNVKKWARKALFSAKQLIRTGILGAIFYSLWLVPRKKELVLFGSDFGFSGNPKYLFLEFQKQMKYKAVWIAKNIDVYKKMQKQGYEVYLCNTWKGFWTQLRAGTLIHSHSIKEDFSYLAVGGATSINCWHGVGLKRSWFRNINAFSGRWQAAAPSLKRSFNLWWARTNMAHRNFVIGTSEEVIAYYPETYHVKPNYILNLGQARNDVFFDSELEGANLPQIFQNGKVIVYMPTHRAYGERKGKKESVGGDIDYKKLSGILEKYGYTFVLKQHKFNTRSQVVSRRYENIIDISRFNNDLDTQLILKYTDILITDYSSCYTDFLLLNRPVVFYCYDLDQYLAKWDLNFDYDYVTPGPKVFDSDELIDALEKLMQGQDDYKEERERVKRVFYSPENQGPVAKKQMDYIIEHIIGA